MKNTEKAKIVSQVLIVWIATYAVSWLATICMRSDNWLFGIILVPVSLFVGAIAIVVTVDALKKM